MTTFEQLVINGDLPASGNSVGLTYCVEGTLVLETADPLTTYKFDACNLIMGAGASIEVEDTKELRITDSDIYSCTSLWKRILIQKGASFLLRESSVSDGRRAIVAEGGSTIAIRDNDFINNDLALEITQANAMTSDPILLAQVFEGNHFEAPSLLAPMLGEVGFAGIIIDNTDGFIIGDVLYDANTFNTIENGIRINDSQVSIRNCSFDNIYDFTSPFLAFGDVNAGNCIYAEDNSQIDVFSVTVNQANTAVHTFASTIFVVDNIFDEVIGGVRSFNNDKNRITIIQNTMNSSTLGVHVGLGTPLSLDITSNTIDVSSLQSPGQWGIGINQMDFLDAMGNPPPFPSTARIADNEITAQVARGIAIGAVFGVRVLYNTISCSGAIGRGGIDVILCGTNIIYENDVTGDINVDMDVLLEASPNNALACNTTTGSHTGFEYRDNSLGTQMVRNVIGDHTRGLLMEDMSIIGVQFHNENIWSLPIYTVSAEHLDPTPLDVLLSQFIIDPSFTAGIPNPAPISSSLNWFDYIPGAADLISCGLEDPWGSGMEELLRNNDLFEEDYQIAQAGAGKNSSFESIMQYNLEQYLLRKLLFHPDLVNQDFIFQDFKASKAGTNLELLVEVEKDLKTLLLEESTLRAELNGYVDQIQTLLNDLELNVQACTNANESELPGLLNNQEDILIAIADAKANSSSVINQIQNNRLAKVPSILSKNESLVAPELYEQSQQQINELLLAELTDAGSMLEDQNLATLNAIAEQCPFLGGNAVYLARALLMNVQATDFSNDCPTEEEFFPGLQSKSNQDGQKGNVFLYPNPTEDVLTIHLDQASFDGLVKIHNNIGQEVYTGKVTNDTATIQLPVAHLTPGIYTLSYISATGEVVSKSFVKH